MDLTGEPEGPPVKFAVPIADIVTGMFCAVAVLAALRSRDRGGGGAYIDMALLDSALAISTHRSAAYLASGRVPRRLGSAHSSIAPYQAFRAGDGRYFIVGRRHGEAVEGLLQGYRQGGPRRRSPLLRQRQEGREQRGAGG
jgi:crotonobetainyl-CoA:carnitine CoA-transferase CaiB-like acyl-CoA transferase